MKEYFITFQTVLNAFKRQWKKILVLVLIFALLGGGAGWLFRGKGMAADGGSAKPMDPVDFEKLAYTQDYYNDCLNALNTSHSGLDLYLIIVSTHASLNAEWKNEEYKPLRDALAGLTAKTAEFQAIRLTPLQSALSEPGALYVPEEFLDGLSARYMQELETIRFDLIAAEAASDIIRQMDAPDFDGSFTGSYTTLLDQASRYAALLKNQAVYEKSLDNLKNHMPEFRTKSRQMMQSLNTAAADLNALAEECVKLADEIAKKMGLTFAPTRTNGAFDVLVTHSHRASSSQEAFAVIVLFCVLIGLCLGIFLAVCQEAKEEKHLLAGQPEVKPSDPPACE